MEVRPGAGEPRGRLLDAMVAVASRHGYRGATVSRVLEAAGMSRATFYEQFVDRDDCFVAACRQVIAPVRADLEAIVESRDPRAPWAIVGDALAAVERDPNAARLVVIESFGGSPRVRAEMEDLLDLAVKAIVRYREEEPEPRIAIPPRALLGGVAHPVALRLFRREGRTTELLGELRRWVAGYRVSGNGRCERVDWDRFGQAWVRAAGERPADPVAKRTLPRGRSALSPVEVANEQRERLIAATARCTVERGYLAMTVADIVERAGVTRAAFYGQFRNKEDAYLATISYAVQGGAAAAAGSFFTDADWPDRIWDALDSFADYVARRPDLAFAGMIEFFSAGSEAIGRSFDGRMAFTLFLEDGYRYRPESAGLPRSCSEAIAGAIEELIRNHIRCGHTARIRELVPQMAYVALAPFTGAEFALATVKERCEIGF